MYKIKFLFAIVLIGGISCSQTNPIQNTSKEQTSEDIRLEVMVKDSRGNPDRNTSVSVYNFTQFPRGMIKSPEDLEKTKKLSDFTVSSGATNENGVVVFQNLEQGFAQIVVEEGGRPAKGKDNFPVVPKTVRLNKDNNRVTIDLSRKFKVSGKFVDRRVKTNGTVKIWEEPISGLNIDILNSTPLAGQSPSLISNEKGEFHFYLYDQSPVLVVARKNFNNDIQGHTYNYKATWMILRKFSRKKNAFKLTLPPALSVSVYNGRDKPIPGAKIRIKSMKISDKKEQPKLVSFEAVGKTNDKGKANLHVQNLFDKQATIKEICRKKGYNIFAKAYSGILMPSIYAFEKKWGKDKAKIVAKENANPHSKGVQLKETGEKIVRGKFVDNEGNPLYPRPVSLYKNGVMIDTVITQDDGTFSFGNVPFGKYRIVGETEKSGLVEKSWTVNEGEIRPIVLKGD